MPQKDVVGFEKEARLGQRIDATKTPQGLILPFHTDRKESNLAKIIKVGPGVAGREDKPMCKEGEYWLIARYIGTVFDLNGKSVTMVKWADCQARVQFEKGAEELLEAAGEVTEEKPPAETNPRVVVP